MRRSALIALWILAVAASLWLLRTGSQLLIPIVIAVLISYILEPIVAWLERHRCPRLAGASLVMLTILGLFGWGVYSLRDDVVKATEALPEAARRAREMIMSQGGTGPGANVRKAADELSGASSAAGQGAGGQQAASGGTQGAGGAQSGGGQAGGGTQGGGQGGQQSAGGGQGGQQSGGGQDTAQRGSAQGGGGGQGTGIPGLLQQGVTSIFALAGHLLTITFLVFFLLIYGAHFRKRVVEIAGPRLDRRRLTASIIDDINTQIQRFLLVRAFTAVIVALATWAVLAWMGVAQAAVWGILAGVFNSIPYFGPVIVSGGLFVVGLVQTGDAMQGLEMAGAALAITSLEGWLLTPPLMGKAERMSALVVFLGLLLWTWIWGAWGTILAVPMLVVVKSVADHVDSLKPIGRLMAP